MVMYLLPALQVQPGGDRAALQESGDRPDVGEGPASVSPASQAAAARGGRERQVDIPQTDADHSRDQIRGKILAAARVLGDGNGHLSSLLGFLFPCSFVPELPAFENALTSRTLERSRFMQNIQWLGLHIQ